MVISGDHFVVGRSREADMVVDDPNVSRRHLELRREMDGWVARDLGSTNGIQVNGRQVNETALAPGDQVTLGLTTLTFELD
jgi:pSer/pThr/pTyr-binding forkhead associated (FHA) protein